MLAQREYHLSMRSVVQAALGAALWSGLALAQGPPASVTSPGFGGHFDSPRGVPASVTSPGFGWNSAEHNNRGQFFVQPICCSNRLFPNRPHPVNGQHHHRPFNSPFAGPVYAVPYYVYPDVEEPVDDTMEQVQPQSGQYLGGPTVFDRRGPGPVAYAPPAERASDKERVAEADAAPASEPSPAKDQPETLLVFKDGHKVEVQNYAIVGDVLYDMTPGHQRKVQLAELDVDATVKQNDDRGIDFRLPPRPVAK